MRGIPLTATQPKPGPTTHYSALHGSTLAGRDNGSARDAAPVSVDCETERLTDETERLAALKGALWASFQAAPMSPVRAAIVDLTMAYTDALRMELKLRAAGKAPSSGSTARFAAKAGVRTY
jgi:hypothetical protein